jgi:spore coat polysaccharide biosynthesis protein SpsF (cytidylyltransferase family)
VTSRLKTLNLFTKPKTNLQSNFSEIRWTVDTIEDLTMSREFIRKLGAKWQLLTLDQMLEIWDQNPELRKINSQIRQKEIYEG